MVSCYAPTMVLSTDPSRLHREASLPRSHIMMIGTVSREGKAKENASKISTMQVRNNLPQLRMIHLLRLSYPSVQETKTKTSLGWNQKSDIRDELRLQGVRIRWSNSWICVPKTMCERGKRGVEPGSCVFWHLREIVKHATLFHAHPNPITKICLDCRNGRPVLSTVETSGLYSQWEIQQFASCCSLTSVCLRSLQTIQRYTYIYIFLISFQFIEPWFQPHSRHLSTSLYPHRSVTFYRFPYASPGSGLIATPEMRLEVVEDASKLAKNVAWGCNWIKHPETWCWKHEKYRGARLRIFKNKQEMGFLQQVELTKKKVGLMQTTHDLAKTHVDLATKSCILN